MTTILETKNLSIGYKFARRPNLVVAEASALCLDAGELVCLLGPNGAGKSTLMRTIARMQPTLGGQILLHGDDINKLNGQEMATRLSIVLTERVDAGAFSAYDLIALGRYPHTNWMGHLSDEDRQVINWAIESV